LTLLKLSIKNRLKSFDIILLNKNDNACLSTKVFVIKALNTTTGWPRKKPWLE